MPFNLVIVDIESNLEDIRSIYILIFAKIVMILSNFY